MMIARKTQSIGLISVILFGGGCLLLAGAVYQIGSMGASLQEEIVLVANNEALKQETFRSQETLDQSAETRERLMSRVLTEDGTINFLAEIEGAARTQGVKLSTQSLDLKERPAANFDLLSASFALEGERDAAFRIIKMFETLPYESTITKLQYQLTKEAVPKLKGSISLEMNIASYDN